MVGFFAIFILCPCWFGRLEAKTAPSIVRSWLRPWLEVLSSGPPDSPVVHRTCPVDCPVRLLALL
jgi:hypothetical protein